jgi:hypothetical protein
MVPRTLLVAAIALLTASCGASPPDDSATLDSTGPGASPSESSVAGEQQRFPDVIEAVATDTEAGWDFDVTVSSPYDTPERYADAWRVVGPDGEVFGVRELLHDHAAEQPFTRSLRGVEIPAEVDAVVVEGRDSSNGWGGQTVEVPLVRG